MDYPPNSDKSKTPPVVEKVVGRVVEGEVARRRRPLHKKLAGTFLGGGGKESVDYVVFGVLIPAAKDAFADAVSQGIERLIFGESRAKSRAPRQTGLGRVDYGGISRPAAPTTQRTMSRRGRALHDFEEIVLTSRIEAEEVVDRMNDLAERYGSVSVADLYELVGLKGTHADVKYGWTDLRDAGVARVRNGFLLDLPEPEPLD